MKCQCSRGDWHSYVKKALQESEMQEMTIHLTSCSACRQAVAEIEEMSGFLSALRAVPCLPETITQNVMAAIDISKYRKETSNHTLDFKLWGRSLVAAGLIFCFINPDPLAATISGLNHKVSWQITEPFAKMDVVTNVAYDKIKTLQFPNKKQATNKEESK